MIFNFIELNIIFKIQTQNLYICVLKDKQKKLNIPIQQFHFHILSTARRYKTINVTNVCWKVKRNYNYKARERKKETLLFW